VAGVTTAGHRVSDWKVVMVVFWIELRLDDSVNLFSHGNYSVLEVHVKSFNQYGKAEGKRSI